MPLLLAVLFEDIGAGSSDIARSRVKRTSSVALMYFSIIYVLYYQSGCLLNQSNSRHSCFFYISSDASHLIVGVGALSPYYSKCRTTKC